MHKLALINVAMTQPEALMFMKRRTAGNKAQATCQVSVPFDTLRFGDCNFRLPFLLLSARLSIGEHGNQQTRERITSFSMCTVDEGTELKV